MLHELAVIQHRHAEGIGLVLPRGEFLELPCVDEAFWGAVGDDFVDLGELFLPDDGTAVAVGAGELKLRAWWGDRLVSCPGRAKDTQQQSKQGPRRGEGQDKDGNVASRTHAPSSIRRCP